LNIPKPFLKPSAFHLQQIQTVSTVKLERKLGAVTADEMSRVREALGTRMAIDWEQPANNDFLLVSQFSVPGALYTCRPDFVGSVNGLPLVVIELKKPGLPARAALDEKKTQSV
jgi:type I site-specific restriction-modification system R (restriction) subunit